MSYFSIEKIGSETQNELSFRIFRKKTTKSFTFRTDTKNTIKKFKPKICIICRTKQLQFDIISMMSYSLKSLDLDLSSNQSNDSIINRFYV